MRYLHQKNSRPSSLSLPGEILYEILRHLDCIELLKCRLVCGSLKRIVEYHSELLYVIELFKNHMVDSGVATTAHSERLLALRERSQAWRNLEWKNITNLDIHGPCTAYELVGGVFAKTNGQDMFFSWLPRAKTPGHTIHYEDVGIQLRDFALDPTQDLVVLLEEDNIVSQDDWSRNVRLHLRTMSTMERHPKAQSPELRFTIAHRITAAIVQTASDVLAVFISLGFQTRLMLWNWQAGQLLSDSDRREYVLPFSYWDFALISSRAFMITTIDGDGAILLYKFSCPDEPIPIHVATLWMPPLQDDRVMLFLSSHSGPFLAKPPCESEFTTSPDSRIQVLSVGYQNGNTTLGNTLHFGFFYVHNRTFEKYIMDYGRAGILDDESIQKTHPSIAIDVPWHEWGPENTRFSIIRSPTHWLRYVQGARLILPPESHEERGVMEVWDFNAISGQHEESQSNRYKASTQAAATLFTEPLRTYLPSRARVRTVKEEYGAFMIDEERVIAVKVDPANQEEIVGLHVYCF